MRLRMIITACSVVALGAVSNAAVPTSITVQGKLTNAAGNPLPGSTQFVFKIFSDTTGGTEIWPGGAGELQMITVATDGLWVGLVGAVNPLNDAVFADASLWLEISAAGTMLPRVRLATGPYAYRVATVDGASGGSIMSKVSIGPGHTNTGANSFVAGANNTVSDTGAVVTGGGNNRARGPYAFIGSGGGPTDADSNSVSGSGAAVVAGTKNVAANRYSFVGAGSNNAAGVGNIANLGNSFVGAGTFNVAGGDLGGQAVVAGDQNQATGFLAGIVGGRRNMARGSLSFIGGGGQGQTSVGDSNVTTGYASAIVCGIGNSTGTGSGDSCAFVGNGRDNTAGGKYSVIVGGLTNSAQGDWSAIPGGRANVAAADFSFAAGLRAKSNHQGTFVWADSTNSDFASTAQDQFLIRAGGGVGIGTNTPEAPLHVMAGNVTSISGNGNSSAVFERNGENWIHMLTPDAQQCGILFGITGNSLMGSIRFNAGNSRGYDFRAGSNDSRLILDSLGNLTADGCVVGSNIACPSDARFKRNVKTIPNAFDKVAELRGVSYEWERETFTGRDFPPGQQVGVIAQEVQRVVPQAVIEQSDGYLAVDYSRLVPLLIEGMKEQQKRIEALEMKLERQTP